jgi:hypothetical protein
VRSRRGNLLALPAAGRWLPPIAAVLERFLRAERNDGGRTRLR